METSDAINAVRNAEVMSRIGALQRIVPVLDRDAKEPFVISNNATLAAKCDQAIVHVFEIFKDFYRRNGYLDDGTVKSFPVREFSIVMLENWAGANDRPGVRLVLDRMRDTVAIIETMGDVNQPKTIRMGARKSLQSRGIL